MGNQVVNDRLVVQGVYENQEGISKLTHLSKALKVAPTQISKAMVWGAGQYYTEDFAISQLTEGVGNVIYIDGMEYNYPYFQGDIDPMDSIAVANTGSAQGQYGQKFIAYFKTRRFKRQNIIHSPSKIQCRVVEHPEPSGQYFKYILEVMGSNRAAYVPTADLKAGAKWERGVSAVEFEESVGVEEGEIYPGEAKNQIGTLRSSMKWAGHFPKYEIKASMPFDKAVISVPSQMKNGTTKMFKYWMDWKEWQHFVKYRRYKEIDHWVSEYNKLPDGSIAQHGPSGNPIPRGDGILNQITNRGTYSGKLTSKRFKNILRDLFYNVTGAQRKHIQMHTGTLGMDLFDRAMHDELTNYFKSERTMGTFVTKSGEALKLGKYFKEYETVDGDIVTVHKNPIFNLIYRNSPTYEGISSFSGEFVFVDMSTYSGEPNVNLVTRKGRQLVRRPIAGVATMPDGYPEPDYASTDKDVASVEWLWEQGISMYDNSSNYRLSLETTGYYL